MANEVTNSTTGEIVDRSLNAEVKRLESGFLAALPPHIPVERFMRVVMTAINGNSDLQKADRLSLFDSAMKAAQDGLLPDGREGALVIFNTKDMAETKRLGRDVWIKKVQWMPMVAGILKKARNSGQISTIVSRVVYAGDKFRNWIDDDGEHIEYEAADDQDRSIVRKVFAMAKLKDGAVEIEVLTPPDVEKIRNASKAKAGPAWTVWWDEMARKSAIRRLSKRLPLSSDLDDLIRRDDELYDFKGDRGEPAPRTGLANPLKDDVLPADETRTIEHAPAQRPATGYDLTINPDGSVGHYHNGQRPEQILDQRLHPDDQVFTSYAEWSEYCQGANLGYEFGLTWKKDGIEARWDGTIVNGHARATAAGLIGRDGETTMDSDFTDSDPAGRDHPQRREPAGETSAPATTTAASTAKTAPAAALAAKATGPTYDQSSESYLDYMRNQFDKATSAAAVKDVWAKTREDRRELLGADDLDGLEKERAAALARIEKKAGA